VLRAPKKIGGRERQIYKDRSDLWEVMDNRTTFRVGCELNYQIGGPSAFIFNVGVVTNSYQRVLSEKFQTDPIYPVEESLPRWKKKGITALRLSKVPFGSPTRRQLNWSTTFRKGTMSRNRCRRRSRQRSFLTFIPADIASRICSFDLRSMNSVNCSTAFHE
jgi:hypothetical protein